MSDNTEDNVNKNVSRLELTAMGIGNSTNEDDRLESNNVVREEAVRALLTNGLDPSIATAAKGLLADIDKSILSQRKLKQDKEGNEDRNEILKDLYHELVVTRGRDFTLPDQDSPVDPAKRELELDVSEFEISSTELITGDDTVDSLSD